MFISDIGQIRGFGVFLYVLGCWANVGQNHAKITHQIN